MNRLAVLFAVTIVLNACKASPVDPPTKIIERTQTPTITPTKILSSATPESLLDFPNPNTSPTPSPTFVPPTPIALSSTPSAYEGTPFPMPSRVISFENAHQIVELAQWGRGIIQDIAYSPDGESVVVTTSNGIYIHDQDDFSAPPAVINVDGLAVLSLDKSLLATTQHVIRLSDQKILLTFPDSTEPLQYSPNGRYIAVRENGKLKVWDLNISEEVITINLYPETIKFSPDSGSLAVGDSFDAFIIDLETKKKTVFTDPSPEDEHFYRPVSSLAFSPAVETLAVGHLPDLYVTDASDAIDVFRIFDGEFLYGIPNIGSLPLPRGRTCDEDYMAPEPPAPAHVDHIAFSPNGKWMAAIYSNSLWTRDFYEVSQLVIYSSSDGAVFKKFAPGTKAIAFSPDSKHIVTASNDGLIQEWAMYNFTMTDELKGYNGKVWDLSLSPDNTLLGVDFFDRARIQNLQTGSVIQEYFGAQITFAPDGKSFALGYSAGHIQIRDMSDGILLKTIYAHTDEILDIIYLPSGDLVSTAADCTTYLWEMPSGKKTITFENYIDEGFREVLGRFRMYYLSTSADGTILIGDIFQGFAVWETSSGNLIDFLPETNIPLSQEIFNYSSLSSAIGILQLNELEKYSSLWESSGIKGSSSFSPSGDLFVFVKDYYLQSNIVIQRPVDSFPLALVSTPETVTTSILFSRDGTFFISAAIDGTIRFWGLAH